MLYDCGNADERERGTAAAVAAVRAGGLVVLPTDTVYGVGADAFAPAAVAALLAAKGRGRHLPPPVLVGSFEAAEQLVDELPPVARALAQACWPGALTIVVRHAARLRWDIGDTGGTVALRMPAHPVALHLLRRTGPLAVSSANLTGQPAATTAAGARAQLGASVRVYLEAGPSPDQVPSTIVDATGDVPRVLRAGALSVERLADLVPLPPAG